MKDYRKELMRKSKLYALIYQYRSEENQEEIKWSDKFEKIDEETDPLGIWLFVEETIKVIMISKGEAVTKMAARSTYQTIHQARWLHSIKMSFLRYCLQAWKLIKKKNLI